MIDIERILVEYPRHLVDARWVALGNAGGFSGSRIWRGTTFDGREFALKEYSLATTGRQLERVHGWMRAAKEQGLPFVPAIEPASNCRTVAMVNESCWDVTSWMPGKSDFHDDPSDGKLFAAVEAIARIHALWANLVPPTEQPCPAILRRWRATQDAEALLKNGPPLIDPDTESLLSNLDRAWALLHRQLPRMQALLEPWRSRLVTVQPCIGDVWHDHVLFEDNRVSGIIDFAAAKVDVPEADLARLLGSLIPGDHGRMRQALVVYAGIRPVPDYRLVEVLDVTGAFGAVVNWLNRFMRFPLPSVTRVAERFGKLVDRLDSLPGNAKL